MTHPCPTIKALSNHARWFGAAALLTATLLRSQSAHAQVFDSKSDGTDGALNLTGRTGTVTFNPKDFIRPDGQHLDPEGDLVFHLTNITIPSGVILRMSAEWTNGPVYLLVQGDVTVGGTIDLSGGPGHIRTGTTAERLPPLPGSIHFPGPGGFMGGLGGNSTLGAPLRGAGPGGGAPGTAPIADRDNRRSWYIGFGGEAAPTEYLVPLTGGSGGGGAIHDTYQSWGSGGGAGGGALLVAANGTINVTGSIVAHGGAGGYSGSNDNWGQPPHPGYTGGGGAGGSIRLVATRATGSGTLDAYGRATNGDACVTRCASDLFPWSKADNGRVRVEAYTYAATYNYGSAQWTRGTPFSTYVPVVPSKPPSLWISEINGQQLPKEPSGGFGTVDGINQYVTLDNPIAPEEVTTIVISGEHLPDPTQNDLNATLYVHALEGKDIVKPCDAKMAESEGDPDVLECTVTIAGTPTAPSFPPGFSRAYARLSWQ